MTADLPLLIVLAGRPGTGKTILSRRISQALPAAYLRIDAIETAVVRCELARPPVGPVGYVVAHEVAAEMLALGVSVVADAVNPVPGARAGWRDLSQISNVVFLETVIRDEAEHRRRVTERQPDLDGQVVPTWDDVIAADYLPWDEARDGPRTVIDTSDIAQALAAALDHVQRVTNGPE